MTITETIQKAIEGGWENGIIWGTATKYVSKKNLSAAFLDPLFWQSLGKAMGWGGIGTADIPQSHYTPGWIRYWHRLIDFLASGGTIEDFFKDL